MPATSTVVPLLMAMDKSACGASVSVSVALLLAGVDSVTPAPAATVSRAKRSCGAGLRKKEGPLASSAKSPAAEPPGSGGGAAGGEGRGGGGGACASPEGAGAARHAAVGDLRRYGLAFGDQAIKHGVAGAYDRRGGVADHSAGRGLHAAHLEGGDLLAPSTCLEGNPRGATRYWQRLRLRRGSRSELAWIVGIFPPKISP